MEKDGVGVRVGVGWSGDGMKAGVGVEVEAGAGSVGVEVGFTGSNEIRVGVREGLKPSRQAAARRARNMRKNARLIDENLNVLAVVFVHHIDDLAGKIASPDGFSDLAEIDIRSILGGDIHARVNQT